LVIVQVKNFETMCFQLTFQITHDSSCQSYLIRIHLTWGSEMLQVKPHEIHGNPENSMTERVERIFNANAMQCISYEMGKGGLSPNFLWVLWLYATAIPPDQMWNKWENNDRMEPLYYNLQWDSYSNFKYSIYPTRVRLVFSPEEGTGYRIAYFITWYTLCICMFEFLRFESNTRSIIVDRILYFIQTGFWLWR